MKQKRFVKLLMSQGMSKRDAQNEAEFVNKYNLPYSVAYNAFSLKSQLESALLSALETATINLGSAIKECDRFRENIFEITNAINQEERRQQ